MNKKILALYALILWSNTSSAFYGYPFIAYRPIGINNARHTGSWQELRKDLFLEADCIDSLLSCNVEYLQSFSPCDITQALFCCDSLTFSGSRVENRGPQDILADYFGLPTDFKSCVQFNPQIKNVVADFNWYWGFTCWCQRFYARLNIPLAHTRWDLNACERVIDEGELNFPAGYMSPQRLDRSSLPRNALSVLRGEVVFGDLTTPLEHGKICGEQKETKIADILVALGYVPLADSNYYLAVDMQAVVPTGTRSHACTVFEPQIGNGHHWAFGVALSGYLNAWRSCDETSGIDIFLDGSIQHLFGSLQTRSFDFSRNCAGSRYVLLEDLGKPVTGVYGNDERLFPILNFDFVDFDVYQGADVQYHSRLFHAIDKTTLDAKIKVDYQADVAFKVVGYWCGFNALVGYNFFVRSRESLICRDCLPEQLGIKGDAEIYGYQIDGELNVFVGINASQSQATLHAGQGAGSANLNFTNTNADNARQIFVLNNAVFQSTTVGLQGTGATTLAGVNGSQQAILLTDSDINNCSGLSPRILSHKFFGSVSYTWDGLECAVPFIGIGGEAEFSGKTDGIKTAISQWGVWFEIGVAY